jgi:hypothetical protein
MVPIQQVFNIVSRLPPRYCIEVKADIPKMRIRPPTSARFLSLDIPLKGGGRRHRTGASRCATDARMSMSGVGIAS